MREKTIPISFPKGKMPPELPAPNKYVRTNLALTKKHKNPPLSSLPFLYLMPKEFKMEK